MPRGKQPPLTSAQAAERIGVSVRTLRNLRAAGDGPPTIQISPRRIGFDAEALSRWQNARTSSRGRRAEGADA